MHLLDEEHDCDEAVPERRALSDPAHGAREQTDLVDVRCVDRVSLEDRNMTGEMATWGPTSSGFTADECASPC